MTEFNALVHCLHQIEEKLAWGDANNWSQRQYEDLAELLERQSGIVISARTLSRLYKRDRYNPDYLPQKSTRQALVRFLGHDSWALYLKEVHQQAVGEPVAVAGSEGLAPVEEVGSLPTEHLEPSTEAPKTSWWKVAATTTVAMAVVLLLTMLFKPDAERQDATSGVVFTASPSGGAVPQTVRFSVTVPPSVADSFLLYIKSRDQPLRFAAGTVQLARLFTLPLLSRAKVTTMDGTVLAALNLHYTSDEWVRSVQSNSQFFELGTASANDSLQLTASELDNLGNDLNKTRFSSKFLLVRNFNVALDSMALNWQFHVDLQPSFKKCSEMVAQLTADSGVVLISFAPKGCEAALEVETPKVKLKGDVDNLSHYTFAGAGLHQASVMLRSGKVLVMLDDTLRSELPLGPKPVGTLRALSFRTGFQGMVSHPELVGPSGKRYWMVKASK